MALRTSIKNLFIPRKSEKVGQPNYLVDSQTIEIWAKQVLDYLNNNGIIEITSVGATVTITNPFGPVTNLEASGGGGGGISLLQSPEETINIANASGPTAQIDVTGDGYNNTKIGDTVFGGGYPNPYSTDNTAMGFEAMTAYTSVSTNIGVMNTAIGSTALHQLGTSAASNNNTAVGGEALIGTTHTSDCTGIGFKTLPLMTSGIRNTAVGSLAGAGVTTGSQNTLIGYNSGGGTTGSYNTTLGYQAGISGGVSGGVAIGCDSSGTNALAGNTNDFALGTFRHVIVFANHTTGSNTMDLGTNSPATGPHPHGWIVIRDDVSGNIGYIPYWV